MSESTSTLNPTRFWAGERAEQRRIQKYENRRQLLFLFQEVVGHLLGWEIDGDQPHEEQGMFGLRHLKTGAQVWFELTSGSIPDERPLGKEHGDRIALRVRWPKKPSNLREQAKEVVWVENGNPGAVRTQINIGIDRTPKQIAASFENRFEVEAIELWQNAFAEVQKQNAAKATRDASFLDLAQLTKGEPNEHETKSGQLFVRRGFAGSPDVAVHGGNAIYINFRGLRYDEAVAILKAARKEGDE